MTKLYIDNILADMDPSIDLSISIATPSSLATDEQVVCSKSITIPATHHNRVLMGDCGHPCSKAMFNQQEHQARLEVDGCIVFEGRPHLTAYSAGAEGYYRFVIVNDKAEWHKALEVSIGALQSDWSEEVTASTIRNSWTDSGAMVRYLPVGRGAGSKTEKYRGRVLPENYHPFIHIGSLLRAMFAQAGYAIESNFMNSDLFNSLYMSGRWSERNSDHWKSEMDFKAVRTEDSPTVKAHYFGRVFASPLKYYNSIGNLVDLPDGNIGGAYNAGCLGMEESTGRICFTPTTSMMVAFDYFLRWQTEYRIKNRQELIGLSNVRFGMNDREPIPLRNDFYDYSQEALGADRLYNFIIFDKVEGAIYHLLADEVVGENVDLDNPADGDLQTRELLTTDQRTTLFQHSYSNPLRNVRVVMEYEGDKFSPLSDWAIYDGCVGERGSKVLEVSLRTYPVACSPDNPVYFDEFYFDGGEEGMEVTVLAGCSIQPIFYPHPPIEGTLTWSDVADLSFTGMDLLVALQELFDLCVQTDTTLKRVRIEPRKEFFAGEIVDFTERIDLSEPIVVEELGEGVKRTFRLAYRSGDKAVEEYCKESGEVYGEWSANIRNLFAEEGINNLESPLFVASLSQRGGVAAAPSASLILTTSGKESKRQCVQNLNFPTKIVSFRGARTLAEGERWHYPKKNDTMYPLLTFYDDGSLGGTPRSLLFENRGGVEGLHSWWDGAIDTLNHSRRIILKVILSPEEMETLVKPNGKGSDFRSLYMLRVEGERVLCHLEKVSDYNPNDISVRMVFVTV